MTHHPWRRTALSAMCVAGMTCAMAPIGHAAPDTTPTPSGMTTTAAGACTPDTKVDVFNFNDFHGRIGNAAKLFTPVARDRQDNGEQNVLLLSAGDSIGGSTFESASQDDVPTLDILKRAGVEASAVGNHEFDKGWPALRDDVIGKTLAGSDLQYLGANVYTKGTTDVPAPLKASKVITKAGVKIGVIGAVTGDLPSLVSPAGIKDLTIGDPVEAVNREAKKLKAEGVDVVIAEYHEGAADGAGNPADEGGNFAKIYTDTSSDVDVVFNGHTHQVYSWKDKQGAPLLQAGSYGSHLAKVVLAWDSQRKELCSTDQSVDKAGEADTTLGTVADIQTLYNRAKEQADVKGQEVIGTETAPITTPSDAEDTSYGAGVRNRESTLTNMVAQMFKDTLGADDPHFIGVQNPGGTRASLLDSRITYKQAAQVLPFANTLMTRKITGAQFKEMLEQQWQRDAEGKVPSRPYLQLGLSDNVTYTYDESREEGDRITSVWVDGELLDPEATYTVGSGSFLINGGDNFTALTEGQAPVDTGRIDLESWVSWIKSHKTLTPSYAKHAVSVTTSIPETGTTEKATFALGVPAPEGVAPDTVNLTSKDSPANQTMTAYLVQGDHKVKLSTVDVKDGKAEVTVAVPTDQGLVTGDADVMFVFEPSGTVVRYPSHITVPGDGDGSTPGTDGGIGYGDDVATPPAPAVPTPGHGATGSVDHPGLPHTGV